MSPVEPEPVWRARPTLFGIATAAAAVALFAYAVWRAGLTDILVSIRRIGTGFLLVLLCSAVRQVARTVAWMLSVDGPVPLRFGPAFESFVTGDTMANLTPFGPVASEGTKAVVVRPYLPTMAALSSIALENIFYALSVGAMIAIGTVALIAFFPMDRSAMLAAAGMLALAAGIAGVGGWMLYRQPRFLSGSMEWFDRSTRREASRTRLHWAKELEERIYGFSARYPRRVARLLFLEFIFHAAAVAEVYVMLALLLGPSPRSLLLAVVLETVDRVITVVFKFIPMRLGVDEAGSGLATQMLALGSATGVTIAIIRKARVLCWAMLGVWYLIRRGLSFAVLLKQARALTEHPESESPS
jgi:hypothetical protein